MTLHIPDAHALWGIEAHRRFVALVTLLAARDGADRVRFEMRPDVWGVAIGRPDGSWVDYAPVAHEAAVGQTLRSLTRTGWTERVWDWLRAASIRPAEFDLQLSG